MVSHDQRGPKENIGSSGKDAIALYLKQAGMRSGREGGVEHEC